LARGSMKNAANCASTCELQDTWTSTAYYGRIKDKQHRCKSRIVTSGRIAYVTGVHNHEPRVKNRNKYRNMLSDIVTVIRQ
jgi:hypothetical protein